MSAYSFRMHKEAAWAEGLGAIELPNDVEAVAFVKYVIRDIKRGPTARYAGWTMDITEGDEDRAAGSVFFDSVEIEL